MLDPRFRLLGVLRMRSMIFRSVMLTGLLSVSTTAQIAFEYNYGSTQASVVDEIAAAGLRDPLTSPKFRDRLEPDTGSGVVNRQLEIP